MKNSKGQEIRYCTERNGITFYTLQEKNGTKHYNWTPEFEEDFFRRNPDLLTISK